jgi:hypothetical protein
VALEHILVLWHLKGSNDKWCQKHWQSEFNLKMRERERACFHLKWSLCCFLLGVCGTTGLKYLTNPCEYHSEQLYVGLTLSIGDPPNRMRGYHFLLTFYAVPTATNIFWNQ